MTVHRRDLSPMCRQQISLFLGSLVMLHWPDAADVHCRAVRYRDVIADEFTVILRDACGPETKLPVTVLIRVKDKVPPTIFPPAQSRTVECDGAGNVKESNEWLASYGGALAFDNCCDVTWR